MKECINNVSITGVLVKMGLEVKKLGQEDEAIAGDVVIRTADGSEHEVRYFAYKYKKDKDTKKFTKEENGMYKGYETAMNDYKSLEKFPEEADIVSVGFATIGVQDYENKKDGRMVSFNDISAKFINRVDPKDVEAKPQIATFEVQGIITKLAQETKKDTPTGNGEVHLDSLGYQATITPVKLVVPEKLVDGFSQAGFYEGGLSKFSGIILNTKTTETIVEKQAFGADNVKTVTTTLKRFEITGGSPQGSIYDIATPDVDAEQEYEAAKSKRRLKLQEIKNKAQNQSQATQQTGFTPASQTQAPANNPFGTPSTTRNPFAK